MINYSTYMWKSPLDETAKEQAYAKNQVTKVMSFDDFVKHISDHNGVFTRGTVKGVVSDTCSCLDVYKRQRLPRLSKIYG